MITKIKPTIAKEAKTSQRALIKSAKNGIIKRKFVIIPMKNLLKQFGIFLVSCSLVLQLAGPSAAFAENGDPPAATTPTPTTLNVGKYLLTDEQASQPTNIAAFIIRAINFLAGIIGSFAFVAIVIGGLIMVTSAGAEAGLQKGKDIIKYAIIGLVVAISAYFITTFVQSIFFEYGS